MPWTSRSASRFTRKARTAKQKRQWAHVSNSALRRGATESSAIRQANAVVARGGGRNKMARRKKGRKGRKHGRK